MKKIIKWGLIGFVALVVLIAIVDGTTKGVAVKDTSSGKSLAGSAPLEDDRQEAEPEPEATPKPTPKPTPAPPKHTMEQQNAIEQAQSYIDLMAFSKPGLIDQLSSPYGSDYPVDVAEYAVRFIDVDWDAEAREQAQSYLDTMSFSKQGLIDQMTSEYGSQFSLDVATRAVNAVYR